MDLYWHMTGKFPRFSPTTDNNVVGLGTVSRINYARTYRWLQAPGLIPVPGVATAMQEVITEMSVDPKFRKKRGCRTIPGRGG
jgi:hypothetical protein